MTKYILAQHDKVVVVLEGGYNVTSVALSSEAVLRALLEATGANTDAVRSSRMLASRCLAQIAHVRSLHAKHWLARGLAE
jgi:acetoin utilization deacetylase AcuC-like enzyme